MDWKRPSKLKKIKTIDRPNENVINLPNLNSESPILGWMLLMKTVL